MKGVVGVTGGIGSGKSAATDHFQQLGITVVDADLASRVIVEPGRPALAAIAEHFGAAILQADGTLDRPALLHLSRQDDRIVYAVLAGSDGPRVTLLTPDGERLEVARDSLLADWYGRFELLWSSPGTTLLSPGDRGPAVLWLRARLATDATPTDPALFDPDLAARVLAFQQLHGLKPDGLVGRQTMIQLDLLAGPGPRLATGG